MRFRWKCVAAPARSSIIASIHVRGGRPRGPLTGRGNSLRARRVGVSGCRRSRWSRQFRCNYLDCFTPGFAVGSCIQLFIGDDSRPVYSKCLSKLAPILRSQVFVHGTLAAV